MLKSMLYAIVGKAYPCRTAGGRLPLIFFFRPTPLGFRQVVQHVQLHVA